MPRLSRARQVLKFWRARVPSKDSFLFSSFECTGFKYTSEDSSEVTFLLVENYQLTTPVGLRIGREFLDKTSMKTLVLSLQLSSCRRALETERGLGEGLVV
jgi:hypothetical protein